MVLFEWVFSIGFLYGGVLPFQSGYFDDGHQNIYCIIL